MNILTDTEIVALVGQASDQRFAMKELYRTWGYEVDIDRAECRRGMSVNLYCYQDTKTLNELSRLNRPAMVNLTFMQLPFFAVLFAIESDSVELLIANQRVKVPIEWFEAHWSGEFTLLWHSPIGSDKVLKPGQQDTRVTQFDTLLSSVLGLNSINSDHFDRPLQQRVKMFQQQQGLQSDGVIGLKTLFALDLLVNMKAPKLVKGQ